MTKTLIAAAVAAVLSTATLVASSDAATARMVIRPMATAAPARSEAPSRLVVRYRTLPGDDAGGRLRVLSSAVSRSGLATPSSTARGTPAPLSAQRLRTLATGAELFSLSRGLAPAEVTRLLREVAADPAVASVDVDRMLQPVRNLVRADPAPSLGTAAVATPDDEFYATHQWHLHDSKGAINVPGAWNTSTGKGIVVAVLDTGILAGHPDFADNVLEGYDFITDAFVSRREDDSRAPGALDLGDWTTANGCGSGSPATASSWHGTHTAGTVAEATHNAIGGAGVAYDAQILPVRVLGQCGGYDSDIAEAIVWASGGSVTGVPANTHPAEVINLSLGGSGACSTDTQAAIDGAVARGTTVVVAAGNSNADVRNFSPANCNNVLVVGANRINGGRAGYSNYGTQVDVAGPGGGGDQDPGNGGWDGYVLQAGYSGTTTPTSGEYLYAGLAGTSMAAPHVAGTVALVQAGRVAQDRDPLSPAEIKVLLKDTARVFPVAIPANTPIGAGIVDANAAVTKALVEPCVPSDTVECAPETTPLAANVALANQGSNGAGILYSIEVAGSAPLTLMTFGGLGDATVYVRRGEVPDAGHYDARSQRAGNTESIRVASPQPGTYYIWVAGSYSGLTVVARQ
ncbi:S8 family peptidase [Stenotrophomonas tumulicola]|uniref:S8 family serine peptidase n=1 Tax=Stenotrophomonas tumulicola TaxID=1685415 RepID=A0A7W3FIM9_9GAMM|nr:S8 family peptidase [Stenotrophomonas tumulicola]MBA8680253.1 S8 family serine peptidase [Stenotrophomonas tumulicola]